jgi:hypothetical protein
LMMIKKTETKKYTETVPMESVNQIKRIFDLRLNMVMKIILVKRKE